MDGCRESHAEGVGEGLAFFLVAKRGVRNVSVPWVTLAWGISSSRVQEEPEEDGSFCCTGSCRTQQATSPAKEVVETIKKSKQKRLQERGLQLLSQPHPILASNCYAGQ